MEIDRVSVGERLLAAATEAVEIPDHPTIAMRRWDCFGQWDKHIAECDECQKTMR